MSKPHVFQLTEEDIERHGTISTSDIGKWCYVIQGCICGFHDTKEDAELALCLYLRMPCAEKPEPDWDAE